MTAKGRAVVVASLASWRKAQHSVASSIGPPGVKALRTLSRMQVDDVRFLDKGPVQKIGGDKVKQVLKVRSGIESETAKKIQRLIKDSKLKVQAASQGDAVRVTGAKRDDLQAAMALIKKDVPDLPLSFNNFRD